MARILTVMRKEARHIQPTRHNFILTDGIVFRKDLVPMILEKHFDAWVNHLDGDIVEFNTDIITAYCPNEEVHYTFILLDGKAWEDSASHPECLPGEVFVGNVTEDQFEISRWNEKRLGRENCYSGCQPGTFPMMVQRSELQAAGFIFAPLLA